MRKPTPPQSRSVSNNRPNTLSTWKTFTKQEKQKAYNRQKLYNRIEEMFEFNHDDKKDLKEWLICMLMFNSIFAIILYLFLYS